MTDRSDDSPRPRAKYRRAALVSPVSFVSQPSRLAISALSACGRPTLGLAIRADRPVQVALADRRRGDVAPGRVGRWRLADLEDGLPVRHRRVVLAGAEPRLAEPQQRRRGDGSGRRTRRRGCSGRPLRRGRPRRVGRRPRRAARRPPRASDGRSSPDPAGRMDRARRAAGRRPSGGRY